MNGRRASVSAPVESITAAAYVVPTDDDPEQDGTFTWTKTTAVVVQASGAGHTGLGWTYSAAAAASVVEDLLAPVVVGTAVADVERSGEQMQMACRNVGPGGLAMHAVSAVDLALWDLKARVAGCSLVDLLGAVRDEVPVYGSGGFTSLSDERLAEQTRGWIKDGMTQIKIKVGRDPRADRDRLELVREAAGDDVALYVDANGGYQRAEAAKWAEEYARAGVTWFEEPLTSDDLGGLRWLRGKAPGGLAIAAGEYVDRLDAARLMLAAEAVDVLQLDATRCGGITGFLAAAALARAHHVDVSAHCAPAAHTAVAAACPNLRHLEWFHDHVRIERLLFDGAPGATGGSVALDRSTTGNGLSLSPTANDWKKP
ncbi:MAG: mandelate racemase [Pseudonocardia sp.]|nr:mandelate racemase [Pseudonocardia sp.]